MANKKFPNDTTAKATLVNNDIILIADSEASFEAKSATIEKVVDRVTIALDLSSYATNNNVLNLDQSIAYSPTEDYHPTTKVYVDDEITAAKAYSDNALLLHVDDFHALSAIHTADVIALQADIDLTNVTLSGHTADVSNPHSVTKSQVGLGSVDNTADLDKPISTATQLYVDNLFLSSSTVYTGSVSGSFTPTLSGYNYYNLTTTGNLTISNPSDELPIGRQGMFAIYQGPTGGNTIDFGTDWFFPNGDPTENVSPSAYNVFRYTVIAENLILTEFIADWA